MVGQAGRNKGMGQRGPRGGASDSHGKAGRAVLPQAFHESKVPTKKLIGKTMFKEGNDSILHYIILMILAYGHYYIVYDKYCDSIV